jgi:flagellar hook-length control protein FliK
MMPMIDMAMTPPPASTGAGRGAGSTRVGGRSSGNADGGTSSEKPSDSNVDTASTAGSPDGSPTADKVAKTSGRQGDQQSDAAQGDETFESVFEAVLGDQPAAPTTATTVPPEVIEELALLDGETEEGDAVEGSDEDAEAVGESDAAGEPAGPDEALAATLAALMAGETPRPIMPTGAPASAAAEQQVIDLTVPAADAAQAETTPVIDLVGLAEQTATAEDAAPTQTPAAPNADAFRAALAAARAERADAPAEVAPPTQTELSAGTAQSEPWQQVVDVLRPLRQFSDGTHRMSIQLSPEELGKVNIELAVSKGTLSLHVVADNAAARDAISSSLSMLRAEIEASGVRTGSFGVGAQTANERQAGRESGRAKPSRAYRIEGIDPGVSAVDGASAQRSMNSRAMDGRLDLRI